METNTGHGDRRIWKREDDPTPKTKEQTDKEGKAVSTQSDGTHANVSNTISELSDGCSSTTRDSEAEFIRLECNEGWHWNQVRSEVERCSEQDGTTPRQGLQRRSISTIGRTPESKQQYFGDMYRRTIHLVAN